MNTSFTFLYTIPGVLGKPGTDLLCEAHREDEEIEMDHIWKKNTDILPELQFEEKMHNSWLLDQIYEAGKEYRRDTHRESLMA